MAKKFNGGNPVTLCDNCRVIMKVNSTIIDNFTQISELLEFSNPDHFYFLQILKRKKDGHDVRGNNGFRTIKSFYIYTKEQLLKEKDFIIELCETHNARAYIHLTPRNKKTIAFKCIQYYADLLEKQAVDKHMFRAWDHLCGIHPDKPKYWLIDIDTDDDNFVDLIETSIKEVRGGNVKARIQTLNGYHLITTGFDLLTFKTNHPELVNLDIHKNNPTLLYFKKNYE